MLRILFLAVLLSSVCLSSIGYAQQEAAVPESDVIEAAAATGSTVRPPSASEPFRLGGLRKRIFSDRDAQRYRVDEESVFEALEAAKAAGDITDDMSIVEKARVVAKTLASKPENTQAFLSITKPTTPAEKLTAVKNWANIVKAIIRILELFESIWGEL